MRAATSKAANVDWSAPLRASPKEWMTVIAAVALIIILITIFTVAIIKMGGFKKGGTGQN